MQDSISPGFLTDADTRSVKDHAPTENLQDNEIVKSSGTCDGDADDPCDSQDCARAVPADLAQCFEEDTENSALLRSFDMIFRLHQRSEDTRRHLDNIDRVLLTSRSTAELARRVLRILQTDMNLVSARILIQEGHPIAGFLSESPISGFSVISPDIMENAGLTGNDPFVLNDPSGPLATHLFGEAADMISSAAVASLLTEEGELGLLCLGSDDPSHYCGGMNTHLISSLAEKISLGLANAWGHETAAARALCPEVDGLFTEAFFGEYVQKEFYRAWRYGGLFSLMAIGWQPVSLQTQPEFNSVAELVIKNLRASDAAATCAAGNLWVLLPSTSPENAARFAERLIRIGAERYMGLLVFHVGITAFSTEATVAHSLFKQAATALEEAARYPGHRIEIRPVKTSIT